MTAPESDEPDPGWKLRRAVPVRNGSGTAASGCRSRLKLKPIENIFGFSLSHPISPLFFSTDSPSRDGQCPDEAVNAFNCPAKAGTPNKCAESQYYCPRIWVKPFCPTAIP